MRLILLYLSWLGIPPHVQKSSSRFSCFCAFVPAFATWACAAPGPLQLFFTLCLSAGRCDLQACAVEFIPTSIENGRFWAVWSYLFALTDVLSNILSTDGAAWSRETSERDHFRRRQPNWSAVYIELSSLWRGADQRTLRCRRTPSWEDNVRSSVDVV